MTGDAAARAGAIDPVRRPRPVLLALALPTPWLV